MPGAPSSFLFLVRPISLLRHGPPGPSALCTTRHAATRWAARAVLREALHPCEAQALETWAAEASSGAIVQVSPGCLVLVVMEDRKD